MENVFGPGPTLEESVSNVTATNSVDLGTKVTYKGEQYVYCYNSGGAAIDKELGVKLITGCSGYSVAATSLTDVANPCVGVAKNATVPTANYFWALTHGFVNVHSANSTVTGDYVAIGLAAGGKFGNCVFGTSVVGTNFVAGYALDVDTASGGTMYAWIRTGA
jgi:hypothetical protein